MDHQATATHVAMRSEESLPVMLNARWVFADDELRERFGEDAGNLCLHVVNLAPACHPHVGLDFDVGFDADWKGMKCCNSDL